MDSENKPADNPNSQIPNPPDVPLLQKGGAAPDISFAPAIPPETTGYLPEIKKVPAEHTGYPAPIDAGITASGPRPAVPKSAGIIENTVTPAEPASKIKGIRTYQADVAESVRGQKTSLVHMVVAEQERKNKIAEIESPKSKQNMVFIIGSLVLLLLGTVAAIVVFNRTRQAAIVEQTTKNQSIIFAENEKTISATGLQAEVFAKSIGKEVASANNKLDTMENIYLTENPGGGNVPLTTQRLFYLIDNRMPPQLLRSLDKTFMLGVHTFNGNHPFLILRTDFYENTFSGMLNWEQYMARDLFPIFGIDKSLDSMVFMKPFEDKTVKNRDTRVLLDENGDILLVYTFKDRQTLVITTSSATLEEVIRRLNSSSPVVR